MKQKMINTLSDNLKNIITDKLYRFSDRFFDDSREKTDFMDAKCVQYIIDHSGVIYLAMKKESSRLIPVLSELYEKLTGLPDFLKEVSEKWLPRLLPDATQTDDSLMNANLDIIVKQKDGGFVHTNVDIKAKHSDGELYSNTYLIAKRLIIALFSAKIRFSRMIKAFGSGLYDRKFPLIAGYYVRYLKPQNLPIRSSPG